METTTSLRDHHAANRKQDSSSEASELQFGRYALPHDYRVISFGTSYINAKMHPDLELPPVPSVLNMRPEVPHEVDMVMRKSLSKHPNDRQQSSRNSLLTSRGAS